MSSPAPVRTALLRGSTESFQELSARYLEEYLEKIQIAVERLDEDQIWWRPAAGSNSVANLLLHLHGNLSLWVLKTLGGQPFERRRSEEFSADRTYRRKEMMDQLAQTVGRCADVIRSISTDDLARRIEVQDYNGNVLGGLFHAAEHMSYHTGQILWITKLQTLESEPLELYPQHRGE
jgi:uncharacterized damage-inducible protein DinB